MPQTVLVVDDTQASRDTIEAMLFREGYNLLFADSGWACLEVLEETIPDLILLDVMMPGMTGYELCERLKSQDDFAAVPVILLTALNKKEDILKGLESGADEFVSKPVSGPEVRARVKNLLKLKAMHDKLQQTLEFRQDLTRFLVHDMRNPLVSIRVNAELASLKAGVEDLKVFENILTEVSTLNGYVDEILLAAQVESGTLKVHPGEVSLKALVVDWIDRNNSRQVEVTESSVEGKILADLNLMTRLVDNLLTNAHKYSEGESVQVSIKVSDDGLRMDLADLGPGISSEHRETIFERHGVAPLKTTGVRQTGLGLYFCKLVCEAHGGSIWMEPNEPRGSKFVVQLS